MSLLRRSLTLLIIIGVGSGMSTRAAAQEADALIEEGVALREQGRDAEARDRFARAYERSHGSRALAQMALAEQALGAWVPAYTHLTGALSAGGPWIDENRQALDGALARISEHVGHLELVEGVPGAEVRVNGQPAGVLPLDGPITVPSGTVVLEISAAGYVPLRRTIELRGGAAARERVQLVPSSATGSSPPAAGSAPSGTGSSPARGSGDGLVSGAIAAYSVAGAGVAVMAIFGGLAAAGHGTLAEGCGATRSCTPADVADTNTFALVSDIGLGVAVAGAVTGTILLALGLSTSGGSEQRASIAPWITPEGGGAVGHLRF